MKNEIYDNMLSAYGATTKYSATFVDKAIKYFICKYLNPTY